MHVQIFERQLRCFLERRDELAGRGFGVTSPASFTSTPDTGSYTTIYSAIRLPNGFAFLRREIHRAVKRVRQQRRADFDRPDLRGFRTRLFCQGFPSAICTDRARREPIRTTRDSTDTSGKRHGRVPHARIRKTSRVELAS